MARIATGILPRDAQPRIGNFQGSGSVVSRELLATVMVEPLSPQPARDAAAKPLVAAVRFPD